jgi:hypothetical protein
MAAHYGNPPESHSLPPSQLSFSKAILLSAHSPRLVKIGSS